MQNQVSADRGRCDDSTDSGLLAVARRRDPGAWARLVDQYSSLVYHRCRRAGLGSEDAADVLQSVMLKLAQHLPRFEKDGRPAAFRRWLATVTRTCIADLMRADGDQARAAGGTDALIRLNGLQSPAPCDTDNSTAGMVQSSIGELLELLEEVEETVESTTWDAFRLTVFEHHTSVEAGARLQMTPAAVRLAKARVLQRLRSRLASNNEISLSPAERSDLD